MSVKLALPVAALLVAIGCQSTDDGGNGGGSGSAGSNQASGGLGGEGGAVGDAGDAGAEIGGAAGEGGTAGDAGEGGAASEAVVPEIPIVDESDLPEPVSKTGFIEIEPHTYDDGIFNAKAVKSTRARLFYHLIVADADAKTKPVFVFFNGGPGYTSMLLHSFGTGPLTLNADAPEDAPTANPSSFTALGNVLYVDARHTGFSYGVADDVTDSAERAVAFEKSSFNPSVDAADFVRVLLRVMKQQPALQNNPVVLVGESYGGTRASVMLELLLRHPSPFYKDTDLSDELAAHYRDVFVGIAPSSYSPQLFAKQFGWQVLIQPLVVGNVQKEKTASWLPQVDARVASALGVDAATLTENCSDNRSKPRSWCAAIDPAIARTLLDPDSFARWMGVAPEAVDGLPASQRSEGFRFVNTRPELAEPAAWIARVGALPEWDRYFSPSTGERVPAGFEWVFSTQPVYAFFFSRAARNAHTLITNAAFDANLPEEGLLPALRQLIQDYPLLAAGMSRADYVGNDPDVASERIRLRFAASPDHGPATQRVVYFPTYAASGHMVTVSEPAKFRRDVGMFLSETGIPVDPQ